MIRTLRLASLLALSPVFAVLGNLAAQTPTAGPKPEVLTVDGAVTLALEKNFDLRIQKTTTANAKEDFTIAKSIFDPEFSLSVNRNYFNSLPTLFNTSSSQSVLQSRVGVNQRLATGAVVSAGGGLDRTRARPNNWGFDPAYNSDVSLVVSQPLLKNAGLMVNRAAIERARLGITRADFDFSATVLGVIRSVESAFFALAFAREQREVRNFSLQVAQKLLDESRVRRETGVATDIDVLQAEVSVANARRLALVAEQQVKNNEDILISLITPKEFNMIPKDLNLPALPTEVPNFDTSFKRALTQSPEYASASLLKAQLRIDADVAKRNRLPQFDVIAGVGYNAREDRATRAVRDVWGNDSYNWQLGATVTLPWGMRGDRARHRIAENNVVNADLRVQQIEQELTVDVRAAIRAVATNVESVKIASLASQLSARQYDLEKARYDAGASTFRRVQEAKEDWDTALIAESQSRVDLRNALADLARLEGSSLEHYRVTLQPAS